MYLPMYLWYQGRVSQILQLVLLSLFVMSLFEGKFELISHAINNELYLILIPMWYVNYSCPFGLS